MCLYLRFPVHVDVGVCVCVCVCVCVYMCVHVCIYKCACTMWVCIYVCMCVRGEGAVEAVWCSGFTLGLPVQSCEFDSHLL